MTRRIEGTSSGTGSQPGLIKLPESRKSDLKNEREHVSNVLEYLPKDSWLRKWMAVWPTAESPKSFILFSAMALLGATLGRSIYLDQDIHKLWPMLNLLLIGPSGSGKSTAIKMGFKLLQTLPKTEQPQIVQGAATPQKLHEDLFPNPHAIIFASELANFFTKEKFMAGMIPYVTELLDYGPIEKRTRSYDIIRIEEPAACIMGGSTVEWLQDQLPDTATSGGFLARFLIIAEEHKGQRVALPNRMLTRHERIRLEHARAECFAEFADLVNVHQGPIDFYDNESADEYCEWYSIYQPATGHLAPFAARAGEFVLRLSMLLAVASHKNAIHVEHVKAAMKLYDYCAAKLNQVVVPFTPQGKMLAMVLQAIGSTPITMAKLCHAMRNFATSADIARMVESLIISGDAKRDKEGLIYRL